MYVNWQCGSKEVQIIKQFVMVNECNIPINNEWFSGEKGEFSSKMLPVCL